MKNKITDKIKKINRRVMVWRIERALDIELFDWQIAKIFDDQPFPDYIQRSRRAGKTTAQILFVLLCPKLKRKPRYGFPPRLYVDNRLNNPNGINISYEAARLAFFFGEDAVCFKRRAYFIHQMVDIAAKLKAAKIKTHHVEYVYHRRTHHL